MSASIMRERRYDSSAWCRSGTTLTSLMSASTGWSIATGSRTLGRSRIPSCRSIRDSTSLTLSVPYRCFPSSTRSPPVAAPKSYHSLSLSLTLNDGVSSCRSGDRDTSIAPTSHTAHGVPALPGNPRCVSVSLPICSCRYSFTCFHETSLV